MFPKIRSMKMTSASKLFACLALLSSSAVAHTWIEQMQVIGDNGSYVGDFGYSRGYVARTDAGFTGFSDKWQLPSPDTDIGKNRIDDSMFVCHTAQRTPNYSPQYPKLSATPGSWVSYRYLENGHVSQPGIPAGKPKGSGTVYIFGTLKPSESDKITDVLKWTADGKGGNGNGWLMAAQNYDDGRCYQINASPISVNRQQSGGNIEQWCESDFQVPANSQVGSNLTTYWIWDWHTEGAGCKDEYYTTCSDMNIVDSGKLSTAETHSLVQQSPQKDAVSDYKSRTAFAPTPTIRTAQNCDAAHPNGSEAPRLSSVASSAMPSAAASSSNPGTTAAAPPPSSGAPGASSISKPIVTDTVTSNIATTTVTAPGKIVFSTITIQASSAPAPSPTASPASVVVSKDDGMAREVVKRDAKVSAHGRLRHNVRFAA